VLDKENEDTLSLKLNWKANHPLAPVLYISWHNRHSVVGEAPSKPFAIASYEVGEEVPIDLDESEEEFLEEVQVDEGDDADNPEDSVAEEMRCTRLCSLILRLFGITTVKP